MTTLITLKPKAGAYKYKKKVGRGTSSGHGKTSCRGHKGQCSRAGGGKGQRFEGGQTPLYRRLPKIGTFKNYPFKTKFNLLNVGDLDSISAKEITVKILVEKFFSSTKKRSLLPVKILGVGEIKNAVTVEAHKFSEDAKKKIEAAGGKAVQIQ